MINFRKMWAQIVGAVAVLGYGLISDGDLTVPEFWAFVAQAAGVVLVWYADNTPRAPYIKAVSAAWTAATAVFVVALTDGLAASEWGQIGIAALTAIAVLGMRNGPKPVAAVGA